jgi:hypothetical protein
MPPAKRPRLPQAPLPPGLPPKAELLDVHDMFTRFNELYFDNALDGVFVTYSRKMTLCAGTCTYMGASGGCRIALSEPILSRRPPNDTVDTSSMVSRTVMDLTVTVRSSLLKPPESTPQQARISQCTTRSVTRSMHLEDTGGRATGLVAVMLSEP